MPGAGRGDGRAARPGVRFMIAAARGGPVPWYLGGRSQAQGIVGMGKGP